MQQQLRSYRCLGNAIFFLATVVSLAASSTETKDQYPSLAREAGPLCASMEQRQELWKDASQNKNGVRKALFLDEHSVATSYLCVGEQLVNETIFLSSVSSTESVKHVLGDIRDAEGCMDRRRYILEGIEPNSGYEVRASYLGSPPSNLQLSMFVTQGGSSQKSTTKRSLLDTAKLFFVTSADEAIPINVDVLGSVTEEDKDQQVIVVEVAAMGASRTWDPKRWRSASYNLRLEKLYFGLVPRAAFEVLVVVVLGVVFTVFAVRWLRRDIVAAVTGGRCASRHPKAQ